MSNDLISWLNAQLDEDERRAKWAATVIDGKWDSWEVEQWTCDEHYGTASWSSGPGYFRAAWARPTQCADCPGFCSTMSKIGAARPYEWHCTKQREEAYRIEDPERSTHL
jgi:hypothetical protein